VDDMIIISNNDTIVQQMIDEMKKSIKIVDMGIMKWILGVKIERLANGDIQLNHEKYIKDVLNKHNMGDCKPVTSPGPYDEDLNQSLESESYGDRHEYMSIVGSLMYTSVISRPDISYVVNKLSQKMINPTKLDYKNAKRVLRYLQGTKNYGPTYYAQGEHQLVG